MNKKDKLTQKQELFAMFYVETGGNATQAYKNAYGDVTQQTAEVNGSRMLKNAKVNNHIQEMLQNLRDENSADAKEVMDFLTAVMRGEIEATQGQLKASELLGKSFRMFTDRVEVDGSIDIEINLTGFGDEEDGE